MLVTAIAGGVGGARLAEGLAQALPPQDLTVIVNTGDDFTHLGLYISPDLDTVCYTLAGLSDPVKGWGRVDESWHTIQELKTLGGPTWFNLGDRDLATHLERTRRMAEGQTLSQVTEHFCKAWGIGPKVLPMSDQPVSTIVHSDEGLLGFQEYFVARRCEPRVSGFHFEGIEEAQPAPGVLEAIRGAELVVVCPSNPWVSIDPILALPGIRQAISGKPVAAVSPIIGGETVKGPAAKIFAEMGIQPSALAVREHYGDLLTAFVLDDIDLELNEKMSLPTLVTDTIMQTAAHRRRLAEEILAFVKNL